jgi:NAD kinase
MIEQVKQTINNFFVPLLVMLLDSLGFLSFLVPKEIRQLYTEMVDEFSSIKPELLAKV